MRLQDILTFKDQLVDLSLPLRPGMFPIMPDSDVHLETMQEHDSSDLGVLETRLRQSCHVGTHMDYASHVDPAGPRAFPDDPFTDSLFPGATVTLAYFMAFDDKRGTEPFGEEGFRFGDEITADDIAAWFAAFESRYPGLDTSSVTGALMRTGWNDRYFEPDFFDRGSPTLSDDGARALMDRGLSYIASDFLFPIAPGRTHDIVMKGTNRYQVENLWNLGALKGPLVALVLAPLKIQNAEGLPARVFGVDVEPQ
jgi:kynurenine formamidase